MGQAAGRRIWGAVAHRPDQSAPIFEQEVPLPGAPTPIVPPRGAFVALLAGNAVLACGPWFVRMADVGPVASGFWRLLLAVPFLLLIARRTDRETVRPGIGLLALIALAGLFFALDLAAWHAGILRTRLANAALFGNTSSFFFVTYGFVVLRMLPDRRQSIAIAIALCGTMLLLGRSYSLSADHLLGDLLCLFAGLAYAGYMIGIDRVRGRMGTWPTLAVATIAGAILLLPMALLIDGSIWPHRWGPLLMLAIGSQVVGQGLLVWTIRVMPPLLVGLGQLTQPVIAATIGWIVFGERLTLPDGIGAIAILSALLLLRKR
jgi:drug/metabolite transporter (DMT)-like permease